MWQQFFLENLHFTVNFAAALVFFAVFWLYFDAWTERKERRELPKLAGFLLVAISFAFHAALIESSVFGNTLISESFHDIVLSVLRSVGLSLVAVSLWLEPLQAIPDSKGVTKKAWSGRKKKAKKKAAGWIPFFPMLTSLSYSELLLITYPFISLIISLLYLRRATTGLERHLKWVSVAFFVYTLSEFLSLAQLLQATTNIGTFNLVKPFGTIWLIEHGLLIIAIIILGKWVWQYLLERFETQLFMIFTVLTLGIFSIVTASFTSLLLRNIQDQTLLNLRTDVSVLSSSIQSKEEQILSDAEVVASNSLIIELLNGESSDETTAYASNFLVRKQLNSLAVVDAEGKVVLDVKKPDLVGTSRSENSFIRRALLGKSISTVTTTDGVLSPFVAVSASIPVLESGSVIGAVAMSFQLDNTFVDGIKKTTGLETALFVGNELSASTLIGEDGKSRWLGIKENDPKVLNDVLLEGKTFAGAVDVRNIPYFVSYAPLTDFDGVVVGMLFVGEPQVNVLQAAGKSIEATFLLAALLILLLVLPSYQISRYISYQLK